MRVDTTEPKASTAPLPTRVPDWLLVVVATVFAIAVVAVAAREPSHVDAVTITNPTDYRLVIDASAGGDGGKVRVGTVDRDSTVTFRQVLDQGDRWVLELSYAGQDAGQVEVDREALIAGWVVPEGISDALAAQQIEPSSPVSPPPSSFSDAEDQAT